MRTARKNYVIKAREAKEQAKMENKLAALQKRYEEEAQARLKMEAENQALQQRLQSVGLTRRVSERLPMIAPDLLGKVRAWRRTTDRCRRPHNRCGPEYSGRIQPNA